MFASLIGRKITNIRPITKKERELEGWENWHSATAVIELDNGIILYPSSDDEGNSAGTLFGVNKDGRAFVVYN